MNETIISPAYRIETPRLVLRCYQPQDAGMLKEAVDSSLEHLRPWMEWADDEPEELEVKIERMRQCRGKFDLGQEFIYGIFAADEKRLLGGSGLHYIRGNESVEIGYWVHKDFVNQGIATETSAALTRVAFEIHHFGRIDICCDPRNLASSAVPRKLGFTHEVTLKKRHKFRGEMLDEMVWTLFAEDFPQSPAASARLQAFDAVGRRLL